MLSKKLKMALRRINYQPLVCDIALKHSTTVSTNSFLTIEFLKLLMYQKGQIPVPFPQLKAFISSVEQEVLKFEEEKNNLINLKPKERFSRAQLNRKRLKFLKIARKFDSDFKSVTEGIHNAFESNCHQVAIVVGTSVFNPQEIIIMDWTNFRNIDKFTNSADTIKNAKANQASLFRHLVTSEELAPFLSSMRPSSIHVVCQMYTSEAPEGVLPRDSLKFPLRTRRVTLRILSELPNRDSLSTPEKIDAVTAAMRKPLISTDLDSHRPVIRRLEFNSPCQLPFQRSLRSSEECDISGIASLDDEDDCFSSNSEEPSDEPRLCWFQIKSSLQGFADDSLFR